MKKLSKRLEELAYKYADEINNYQEYWVSVRMKNPQTMLIYVTTENGYTVCAAHVPLNELPYRMAKKVLDKCKRMIVDWFILEIE